MITKLKIYKDSDSDGDAFDKMVGADTSRTSANGSSGAGKRERDSSPILDSDDDDDDFAVSKPKPQGTLMN